MANSVYSFADVIMTINHPAAGLFTLNGQGIGNVSITYSNDNTSQDLAADGSVMTSKIIANNGNIAINVQQTSPVLKWLKAYFNQIMQLPTNQWAAAVINISSPLGTGDIVNAINVAPTKRPDQPYEKEGQNVTWNFMAAQITMF